MEIYEIGIEQVYEVETCLLLRMSIVVVDYIIWTAVLNGAESESHMPQTMRNGDPYR